MVGRRRLSDCKWIALWLLVPPYVCVLALSGAARAAPPKVESLFPGGGKRGTTVTVTANGAIERWPVQVRTDRPEVQFVPAEEKGKFTVTIPAEAAPGLVRVRCYDAEGTAAVRGFFIGGLPEVAEVEPNNEPRKAQVIEIPAVVVNGQLNPGGDADVFSVPLARGQTLAAVVEAHRLLGSPVDCVLQIVSSEGFVLAQNDDERELDPQLVFTAPADGRYLVRVFGFPALADSSIALSGGVNHVYRLTLTTGGYVDHAWPLAVPRDAPGEVLLRGWNLPGDGLKTPVAALPGAAAVDVFHPAAANPAAVPLEPHSTTLEAEPNDRGQPQLVALPTTISGRIDGERDEDAFLIQPQAGETWQFRLDGPSLASAVDPVLKLLDAEGKTIAMNDDVATGRDAELLHTFATAGAFRLLVSDLHRRGGFRYVYRLRGTLHTPHPRLTVAADNFTLAADKPLEIPVAIERRQGFAEEMEFAVEGLPEGVALTPIKSLPQGETAAAVKLVLTVSAGGASWSGPIKIVGRAAGPSQAIATAVPVIPSVALLSQEIWLTVISK